VYMISFQLFPECWTSIDRRRCFGAFVRIESPMHVFEWAGILDVGGEDTGARVVPPSLYFFPSYSPTILTSEEHDIVDHDQGRRVPLNINVKIPRALTPMGHGPHKIRVGYASTFQIINNFHVCTPWPYSQKKKEKNGAPNQIPGTTTFHRPEPSCVIATTVFIAVPP